MKLLTVILFFNFLSENIHGIAVQRLGENYALFTVGEVIRTPLLFFMIIKIAGHLEYKWVKNIFIGLILLVILICLQGVAFQLDPGDCIKTLSKGLRWSYVFIAMLYAVTLSERQNIEIGTMITRIKWLIVIFYSIPIFLALFGIVGSKAYADTIRQGYIGFIMNNNVAASLFVFMMPFYLICRSKYDYMLLFLFLISGLLTGAKLIFGGFAIVLGAFLLWKIYSALFRKGYSLIGILKIYRRPLALVLVLGVGLSFTPLPGKIMEVVEGMQAIIEIYTGGSLGYESTLLDAVTSHRTSRVYQFLDWARESGNLLPLLIGGGMANYDILYAEVDWVDVTALFGLTGLLAYYGTIGLFLVKIYRVRQYPYAYTIFFMLLLATGVSLTSGHTYDNPAIGILIGVILGLFFAKLPHLARLKTGNFARHEGTASPAVS